MGAVGIGPMFAARRSRRRAPASAILEVHDGAQALHAQPGPLRLPTCAESVAIRFATDAPQWPDLSTQAFLVRPKGAA